MFPDASRPLTRGGRSPAVPAIVLVVLFLGSSLGAGMAGGLPALSGGHASSGSVAGSLPRSAPGAAPASAGPIQPLGSVQRESGLFFENDSTFANLPLNETPCGNGSQVYSSNYSYSNYSYYYNDVYFYGNCYAGAQNPSTISLGNNEIGVGYSVLTNRSMVGCSDRPDVETSQVAFALSPNAGASFGPAAWIGNTSCAYLQALEPSFTLSTNGDIYGAFVEANYGNATNTSFPFGYDNRSDDALAFTESKDGGSLFTAPVTLTSAGVGNITRPVIGAFGSSVYVVYENIDNNSAINLSTTYPYSNGPAQHPISLEVLTSTDGGTTWTGPVTLPGMNASAGYNAMSPSISVSSKGTVAVAYATNRSCFDLLFGYCSGFGDNIVVSTSTTNGTSWVGPVLVSPNSTGEYQCADWNNDTGPNYYYGCYAYVFQWLPSTSVAWSDVAPNDLYVTWSGGYSIYNASDFSTYYGTSAVFAAASNDAGAAWNDSIVTENTNNNIYVYNPSYAYDPVVGVHRGWVYVSYVAENDSYCYPCAPGSNGRSYWLATSLNGVQWFSNTTLLLWNPMDYGYIVNAFAGYQESIGFSEGGPVVTFSQPTNYNFQFGYAYNDSFVGNTSWYNDTYWYNETGFSNLTTVFAWSGNTTVVNFTERGLPAGTTWNFSLGSAQFSSDKRTIQVSDVPTGPGLYFIVPYVNAGFWTRYAAYPSVNGTPVFSGPTNVSVPFIIEYGIQFLFQPLSTLYFDLSFDWNGSYYDIYYSYGCYYCNPADPALPWYFPVGTVLNISAADVYSAFPVSFWTGTGNGSSTNFGNSTSITVDGVINETAWSGAYGSYGVTFSPEGLPAGSAYYFTFEGTAYSGISPSNISVPNVVTGAYAVSNIVAPGSGGYEYFGQVSGGDEVYIPANPVVVLNFSYAYVDLDVAPGTVSFHAAGLAVGDPWQLSFNGTSYSGSTPWINVTTRPGTFAVSAAPVEAAFNDTAQYQPSGVGPTQAVTLGATYPVNYTPTYRVEVVASTGGTVSGAGSHWLAPGTTATYSARANSNYAFLGWTGVGAGSYSGPNPNASVTANGPISESASFEALPTDRFNLTVGETGLPAGVWWTVELDGIGYSSVGTTMIIPDLYPCSSGSGGSYSVVILDSYENGTSGIQYVPSGYPISTCTNGASQFSVTFTEQFLVTPVSTGGGSAAVDVDGHTHSAGTWVTAGTTAGIEATAEFGYVFSGWVGEGPGNYTGLTPNDELTPTGPVTEVAYFTAVVPPPTPLYTLSFHAASSLPAGTAWGLVFNGTHYSSTTSYLNITGVANGTYPLVVATVYSSDRLSEFVPTPSATSILVSGVGAPTTIDFTVSYYVSVSATPGGTVVTPASGYVEAGKSVALNATPDLGYTFVGWAGTGVSSYSGSLELTSLVISGPVTEVATFAPIPATSSSGSGLGPNTTTVLVALALVGLVAGVGVGYAVFRRRSSPPAAPPAEEGGA